MIAWLKRLLGIGPPPIPPPQASVVWEVASSHYHEASVLLAAGWEPFAVYVEGDMSGTRPLYYFKRRKP